MPVPLWLYLLGAGATVGFSFLLVAALLPAGRSGDRRLRLALPSGGVGPSPNPLSGRPAHRPFRGLLGVHSRCGPHTRAVTKFVTAIRGLQTFRRLHACPSCFRLERLAGRGLHPLESAAFSRRTWKAVIRSSRLNVANAPKADTPQ